MPQEYTVEQKLKVLEIQYHDPQNGEWYFVRCPFHQGDDAEINAVKGRVEPISGLFKCFKCNHSSSFLGFVGAVKHTTTAAIKTRLDALEGKGALDEGEALVELYHQALLKNHEYLKLLDSRHGITITEVLKYRLGFNAANSRVTIPIYVNGILVNIRQYSYTDRQNKVINIAGQGKIQFFLGDNIESSTEVYIAEGEFKAIILNRFGFNSVATTGGAKHWKAAYNERFKDKDVIIVYDVDEAGRLGASIIASSLSGTAKSIRNVYLKDVEDVVSDGKRNGDITDYFVKKNKTADDFRRLVLSTEEFSPPKRQERTIDTAIHGVKLSHASKAEFHHKRIAFRAIVSAKDASPYISPSRIRVECGANKDYCGYCHVSKDRSYTFDIKSDDPRILDTLHDNKSKEATLKELSGIYPKCNVATFNAIESRNVEELKLIPVVSEEHSTDDRVAAKVYNIGHGLTPNTTYDFKAIVCTEKDQHATMLAYESERAIDDISNFHLKLDLTCFQPGRWTVDDIEAKLTDLYEDLSNNVTRIYNRQDLHIFYDLAYHSCLYIKFQGEKRKGWVDALCIGDSGQGKTECAIRLIKHYNAGERVDTKNSSIAGLVGGLSELQKRWFLSWGTIPLNDRRLVFLEEVKGMPVEHMGQLTDMRSTGIAQIKKIEGGITNARTRLVWISNPRTDRKLCSYNYGVDAIKELIGSLEDIRRFDMCIAVGSNDVSSDVINMDNTRRAPIKHNHTSDLCSHLVMWAWSRNENQIIVEEDATTEILSSAIRMGRDYSSSCPIVEPADQRLKLLRLSTALAARTFSTEDGETLIVRKCHVEYVYKYLCRVYNSPTMGYGDYSKSQLSENNVINPEEIKLNLRNMPNARDSVKSLIETDVIETQTLIDLTEWNKDKAGNFLGLLVRKMCVRKLRRSGYRKTPAFTDLLKELDREGLPNKTIKELMEKSAI